MARSSIDARLQAVVRIHREIAAGDYPSATRLGAVLQVTPKTARKYIGILSDTFGLQPVYNPFRHGYCYCEDGHPHLVPRLTEDEVVAVFLIEEAARALRGTPVQPVLESVLGKLALMLPTGSGLTLDQVSSALSLRMERAAGLPGPDPRILTTLFKAVFRHRRVQITYQGRERQATTQREVDPLHLARCEGQWYLVGFCHLRKAIRTFVPARITKVRLLAENFAPPKDFDHEEHFRTAFGIVVGYKVSAVVLRFDPEVVGLIRERQWHGTQKLEELAGGEARLTMTCSQSQELIAWLLSWGEHVVVESPSELARVVAEAHRKAGAKQVAVGGGSEDGGAS